MRTLAYSEDLDEMLHNASYHQGLHCLLRQKPSSEKENTILFAKYSLWPLNIYNGASQIYCVNQREESISA